MRFNSFSKAGAYQDTMRKRAAALRKQRLEREKLPLFADIIAETQPDLDTVMAAQTVAWDEWQSSFRDDRARKWRAARTEFYRFGPNMRPALRDLWRECPYPGSPEYLLCVINGVRSGRINLECPPWRMPMQPLKPVDFDAIRAAAAARRAGKVAA